MVFTGASLRAAEERNLLPNGSFEFWDGYGDRAREYKARHIGAANPALPVRWAVNYSWPSSLKPSSDCHGGKSALAVVAHRHGLPVVLEMVELEVIPQAVYSFGFWLKGKGKARLLVNGLAVEGHQKLAEVEGAAGEAWVQVKGSFTVPRHLRNVALYLSMPEESDCLIDDVFISALLDDPYDADAVLGRKYGKDEHTLLFEDFDGTSTSFMSSSREVALTDEKGGRFGRGLRLDRRGCATIPLGIGKMPVEGTLEFWISPDSNESMPYLSLMENKSLISIGHWPGRMEVFSEYPQLKDACKLRGYSEEIDVYRMRKGVWHHVAVTWDRNAMRLYIDGVLSDMKTVAAVEWPAKPSFIQLSDPLERARKNDGTIDEIRLSDVRRYGPAIPRGSTYTTPPMIVSAVADPGRKTTAAKAPPAADLIAAERKKMIGAMAPTSAGEFEEALNGDGDYVYEATSVRPIVRGGQCVIESNKIVKGVAVVTSGRVLQDLNPDYVSNAGIYWTLKNIRKGPYWIGVLYAGNGATGACGPLSVYLNGRIVQLATQSNPVQVATNVWFIEALAGHAEDLEPGDEITAAFNWGTPAARLILHGKAPAPASDVPWRMPGNFGGHQWKPYTALGVNIEGRFLYRDGKGVGNLPSDSIQQIAPSIASLRDGSGKVGFAATLSNPLGIAVTVDYRCVLKTFYGETVAEDKARLTIPPHERIERKLSFDWKEGELTHFADLVLLGVKPPDLSRRRAKGGLGWPKYETLSYFPGQRHILPWPDPFNTRVIRRVTIAEPFGGARQTHALDGNDWEMGYTTSLEPPMPVPADITFQRIRVPKSWGWPSLDSLTPRPHGAYFRRSLNLPGAIAGRSFKLVVSDVNCEATAYVNGQKTGNVRGEDTPLVCDITRAVKPGSNEVVIVVRDLLAIMDQSYVNRKSPAANLSYLDAPGIFGGNGLGIGSVEIQSAPAVSSEDVFISTSVREGKITAKITAANRGSAAVQVRVAAEVLDDGQPILKLGEEDVFLKPDQPLALSLEAGWKNAQRWQPGNPYLYALRVTMVDAKTGQALDARRDRFGFRESWIDGPNIMFNGYPIKPVGYSPMTRFSPKGHVIFTRGGGRDWLDEVGLLGYKCISGLRNTPSQHNVESDKFWKAAEENNIAALKLQQNSPHILAWDLSNEWLCFFNGDPLQGARRFKALSDAVRAYDPTRWTLANAEGDLCGLLDNQSFHYMRHYYGPPNPFTMNGKTPYFPDESFWRPLDRHLRAGEAIQLCPIHGALLIPDKKVIMDNEFLWKVGDYMPPGLTRLIGEDDILSPAVDSSSGPAAWMWKTLLDGHRDLGVSTINIYSYHAGAVRGGYLEQTFIMPENQHHGFSGSRETRRFTLVNGLFRPCKMTFRWSLTDRNGKTVAAGKEVRKMISGDVQRGEFAFELPKVAAKSLYTLRAELASDGGFVCAEEWDIDVWPAKVPEIGTLARQVLLYDPTGATVRALDAMKVTFRRLDSLVIPAGLPSGQTLIIGENALNPFSAGTTAPLAGFVERGGRVLVLAQKAAPVNLPVETSLEPRNWSSQVFVRAGSHPILEGINSYDLHFWQPDRSVGTGAYRKPSSGSFITLVDSSRWEGMDWVEMMEVFRGKGSYLLCQLPLASRQAIEPMARELLARSLRYACGESAYACPVKTLCAVTDPSGEVAGILQKLQIRHRIAAPDSLPDDDGPVLLDADTVRAASPEQKAKWAGLLRAGARVVLVNPEPGDSDWISQLAGSKVAVSVPPYRLWDGRGFRKGWSKYTAGLSHLDLYRKRYSGDERASEQAEDTTNVIEPFQYYSAGAEKGRELVFPGALVEVSSGKGLLLIDQRRWTAGDEALAKLAMRNVSSLMTALDVSMSSYIAPRALPADLAFRTVDLSPVANHPLRSEGGAALRIDLKDFPAGRRNFLNVPFVLAQAPNNSVALAAETGAAKGGLPGEVVVPLGFTAEGLYFLHAVANAAGGLVANYRIVYDDGSFFDVPVKGGVNIADWNALKILPGADIAWTGSSDVVPMAGVYRMLWVNHKPETPIKALVFSNPEMKAFPVLVGLTAAARRETLPVTPENAAKAGKLLADGRAAFKADKLDDARRLLREAVLLDPSLRDAYQALADAAERKGDDDLILDAYRLWSISGPRLPLPWNRIGEILEKKQDKRGALEAYKRSLQIEWNQPPIMEAVRRLESGGKP
jgi:hypothetical protein